VVRRWGLTAREVEVLALLARASSIRQIGRRLDIHPIEPPTHPASWPGAAAAAAFWTTAALIGHGPGHVTDPCRTYPRPGQRCLPPNTYPAADGEGEQRAAAVGAAGHAAPPPHPACPAACGRRAGRELLAGVRSAVRRRRVCGFGRDGMEPLTWLLGGLTVSPVPPGCVLTGSSCAADNLRPVSAGSARGQLVA
jgi:hypothetical protein